MVRVEPVRLSRNTEPPGNTYTQRVNLRQKSLGLSFPTVVAIGIVAALFVPASPALAAVTQDSGLEELWEQYPLDSGSDLSVRADPVADEPAFERGGVSSGRTVDVATDSLEAWEVALVLAAIAALVASRKDALLKSFGSPGRATFPLRERLSPRTLRLSPLPAATSDAGSSSRAVLNRLLGAATASVPPSVLAVGTAANQWSTARASTGVTVTPASAEPPKSSADQFDRLKHKPSMDAATLLKDKERSRARIKEQLANAERTRLKQKLAAPPHASAATRGDEIAAAAKKRADLKQTAPQSAPKLVGRRGERPRSVRQQAATPRTRSCEVKWWRGYVMSEFFVVETDSEGIEKVIACSPSFRWHKRDDPPETPEATAALSELINRLQQDGWTLTGRGESWFNVRLQTYVAPNVRAI